MPGRVIADDRSLLVDTIEMAGIESPSVAEALCEASIRWHTAGEAFPNKQNGGGAGTSQAAHLGGYGAPHLAEVST